MDVDAGQISFACDYNKTYFFILFKQQITFCFANTNVVVIFFGYDYI